MDEQEIAYAIGWLLVASGFLAVMLSSIFDRHGYKAAHHIQFRWPFTCGPYLACRGRTRADARPNSGISLLALMV